MSWSEADSAQNREVYTDSFDAIPDGEYKARVSAWEWKETKKGATVFTIKVDVKNGDQTVQAELAYVLVDKNGEIKKAAVGGLREDLRSLGFEADKWISTSKHPIQEVLPKLGEHNVGVGLLFKIEVKRKKVGENTYINKRFKGRIGDDKLVADEQMLDDKMPKRLSNSWLDKQLEHAKEAVPF